MGALEDRERAPRHCFCRHCDRFFHTTTGFETIPTLFINVEVRNAPSSSTLTIASNYVKNLQGIIVVRSANGVFYTTVLREIAHGHYTHPNAKDLGKNR